MSHILSSRLSSRPMGWSRKGVDQMSHLRAYKANGGDMLELAKMQRSEVGFDREKLKQIYFLRNIKASEKKAKKEIEKYYDVFNKSFASSQIKKMGSIPKFV